MKKVLVVIIGLLLCSAVWSSPVETNLQSTKVIEGLKGQVGKAGTFNTFHFANDLSPSNGEVASWNTGDTVTWEAAAVGDVTAGANLGDNLLIRGDGAGKGIQNSGIDVDDSDNVSNIPTLTLEGVASILADATASGVLTFGSVGGTNNENITLDGETDINIVTLGSTTGAVLQHGIRNRFKDGIDLEIGTSADVNILWNTVNNHHFTLATAVGSSSQSGYVVLKSNGNIAEPNHSPTTTSADPVFRWYSSDATNALDYGEVYHNQTNCVFDWGIGDLIFLNTAGGNVGIGTATPSDKLEIAGIGADLGQTISVYSSDKFHNSIITYRKSASDVLGTKLETIDGEILGEFFFEGCDSGNGFASAAKISVVQDGAAGASVLAADMKLETYNGSAKNTNQLFLDDTGSVGINTSSPSSALHVDSNAADTVAIATLENTARNVQLFLGSGSPEGVQTASIGDLYTDTVGGVMYIKNTGSATNTGWKRMVPDVPMYRPETMTTQGVGTGLFYLFGHYDFASADSNLTQASPTQTHGVANEPHASHQSLIAAAAGAASGGSGVVEIEVSGTSITEAGVRTTSDTEVIVADITAMSTDEYFETTKKWLGTVTYTLQNAGGGTHTTFNADFNYGHAKYADLGDRDFTIIDFKVNGLAGANDSAFDVKLMKHSSSGWTYAASGFVPGNGTIVSLATDYSTESDLANGEGFHYDREEIMATVIGSSDEGYIVEITTGANNAIEYLNAAVGVLFN